MVDKIKDEMYKKQRLQKTHKKNSAGNGYLCRTLLGRTAALFLLLYKPFRKIGNNGFFRPPPVDLKQFSRISAQVISGDILLRKGRGFASDVIVRYFHDGTGYSHCALLINRKELENTGYRFDENRIGFGETAADLKKEDLLVVQSTSAGLSGVDGIQIQTLRGFLRYSVPGTDAVYRPVMDTAVRPRVVCAAAAALKQAGRFDNSYNLDNSAAAYCTSMIYHVFRQAGWQKPEAWQTKHGILSFTSFLQPSYFKKIL
jgi:hypothetical protein